MIILTHELLELITDNNAFIVLVKSIAKRASYHNQACFPSIATMEKDTGMSRHTVIDACKWLKEKGIIKVEQRKNDNGGDTSNFYVIETDLIKVVGKLKSETPVQNLHSPSAENAHPPVQNLHTNHKHNLTTSSSNQKKDKFSAENYIKNLDLDLNLKNILLDWLEVRKAKKTVTTQKSIDLAIKTIKPFDLEIQIKMVENSILNGWTGIFEIKNIAEIKEKTYQANLQNRDDTVQLTPEQLEMIKNDKERERKQKEEAEAKMIKVLAQLEAGTFDFELLAPWQKGKVDMQSSNEGKAEKIVEFISWKI